MCVWRLKALALQPATYTAWSLKGVLVHSLRCTYSHADSLAPAQASTNGSSNSGSSSNGPKPGLQNSSGTSSLSMPDGIGLVASNAGTGGIDLMPVASGSSRGSSRAAVLDAQTRFRSSPLVLAVRHGHVGVVRMLLAAGASVADARDYNERNLLMRAARGGNPEMVRLVAEAQLRLGILDVLAKDK